MDANTSVVPPTSVAARRQALNSEVTQINGFTQDHVLKGNESLLAQALSAARTKEAG